MKRSMLLLLACFAFNSPASAQSSNDALRPLLVQWGFPPEVLSIFFGSEPQARQILGPPAGEAVHQNEIWGGRDFRELTYRLSGGRRLTLTLCTDDERRARGIDATYTFCEMGLEPASERIIPDDAQAMLLAIAESSFGACDTRYFRFHGLIVSFRSYVRNDRWRTVVVLEPEPPRDAGAVPVQP